MKKNVLLGGGVLAVAVLVGVGVWLFGGSGGSKTGTDASGKPAAAGYTVVSACKALTLADATAVLGGGTKAGATNGQSDTASGDVAVSTCSYSGASGLTVQDTRTVTLLARSAKTAAGAASNKDVFGKSRPVGKQPVPGVGDDAFWDSALSQLDVLKGNNWYIIGNMSGTHADSGQLDVSRAVYDQIKSKL